MHAMIISGRQAMSDTLRKVFLRQGYECGEEDILPLEHLNGRLMEPTPQLIVVDLSPNQSQAIEVIHALQNRTTSPLLVLGPASDAKLILKVLREGAGHYLDESEPEKELEAVLERIQAEKSFQPQPGHVIALVSAGGGGGASTLAANLAVMLAKDSQRCALFDLQLETDDLTPLLDLKPNHTVAELCQLAAPMDRAIFERALTQHNSGVFLLASPAHDADLGQFSRQAIHQSIAWARRLFPHLVVDAGTAHTEVSIEALRDADIILVVFRLNFSSLRNVRRLLDHLTWSHVRQDRILLIANQYGQAKELTPSDAEKSLGIKIAHFIPDDPKTFNQANNKGIPAVLDNPDAKACKRIVALAGLVVQKLTETAQSPAAEQP